jgi:hypothetical protein
MMLSYVSRTIPAPRVVVSHNPRIWLAVSKVHAPRAHKANACNLLTLAANPLRERECRLA